MSTWFVVGYYGFHNVGDDVVLQKTLEWIRIKDPYARTTVLSAADYPDLDASVVLRRHPIRALFSLSKSDEVIFGGGSLFQDKTSFRSFCYYFAILAMARLLRKHITLLGHGFSGLRYRLSARLLRWGLRGTAISVRDSESADCLLRLGVLPKPFVTATDLAYFHQTAIKAAFSQRTGLSLRTIFDPRHLPALSAFVQSLRNSDVLFYDCQPPLDRDACNALAPDFPCNFTVLNRDNYLDATPCPDRMVVMRYHALVWASLRGIPCLVLAYDSKVRSLAEGLGQIIVDLTSPKTITLTELREKWQRLEENHPHYQQAMQRNAQQYFTLANTHLTL